MGGIAGPIQQVERQVPQQPRMQEPQRPQGGGGRFPYGPMGGGMQGGRFPQQNYGKPGNPFLAMHQGNGFGGPQKPFNPTYMDNFGGNATYGNPNQPVMPQQPFNPQQFDAIKQMYLGQTQTQPMSNYGMVPGSYVSGDSIFGPNGNRIGAIGAPPPGIAGLMR